MNAPEKNLATAERFVKAEHKLLINGRWIASRSGKTFDVFNPATGEVISKVAEGDKADVDQAVAAARAAFPKWSALVPAARSRILWQIGDLIDKRELHSDTCSSTGGSRLSNACSQLTSPR